MEFGILKSLHIIFVVTWFAGLFYIFRLLVYHAEAEQKPQPDQDILLKQYRVMQWRLWYIITWPSAVLTLLFGPWLLWTNWSYYLQSPWMHVKLFFVLCLLGYHLKAHNLVKKAQQGVGFTTGMRMRMWNEVGTILLVAIVFAVVNKDAISWVWGTLGLVGTGVLLTLGIQGYKKIRNKKSSSS
jgi:putative membrane protein